MNVGSNSTCNDKGQIPEQMPAAQLFIHK